MTRNSVLLASAALLMVPIPALQAQAQIERVQFELAGTNDEWVNTGLRAESGDVILVFGSGQIVVGPNIGRVDASGVMPSGQATQYGYLTLKFGQGAALKVGAQNMVLVGDAGGSVKIRLHDSNYSDNSGQFTVDVVRIPAAAIPAPRKLSLD